DDVQRLPGAALPGPLPKHGARRRDRRVRVVVPACRHAAALRCEVHGVPTAVRGAEHRVPDGPVSASAPADPIRDRARADGWRGRAGRRAASAIAGLTSILVELKRCEKSAELVVRVEREHVCDIMIGTYDDDRATLAIDAAHVENVRPVLEVGSIRFLVIDESEAALARKQDRRQSLDLDVAVIPLKHRANVDDAVDVRAPWRESANRRT